MNTKYTLFVLVLLFNFQLLTFKLYSQYGFGTNAPDSNSVLHLASPDSSQGLILPYVTTSNRPLATTAIKGMMIYNLDDSCIQVCNGVTWNCMSVQDTSSFTEGSVIFADSLGRLSEDNPSFFYNDSLSQLRVGDVSKSDSIFGNVIGYGIGDKKIIIAKNSAQSSAALRPGGVWMHRQNGPNFIGTVAYNYFNGLFWATWHQNGTPDAPSPITSGQSYYQFNTEGYDGSVMTNGNPTSSWGAYATENHSTSERGTRLQFSATLNGNYNRTNLFNIGGASDIRFNTFPNTRDDASTTGPINFLYTDGSGNLLSSGTDVLADSIANYLDPDEDWTLDADTLYSAPDSTVTIKGGNVGVGTIQPTSKLEVVQPGAGAGIRISRTTIAHDFGFTLSANVNDVPLLGIGDLTTNDKFALVVDSQGYVGIGTSIPVKTLHVIANESDVMRVESSSGNAAIQLYNNNGGVNATAGTAAGRFEFSARHNNAAALEVARISGLYQGNGTTRTGDLLFYTSNSGGPSERLRILSTGNVGIGTTNPIYKLHIHGTGDVTSMVKTTSAAADAILRLEKTSINNSRAAVHMLTTGGNVWAAGILNRSNGFDTYEISPNNGSTIGLAVNPNGNVGVGTLTPSNKLHVSASSDPVKLEGLQNDVSLDTVVMVDASGVLHKRALNSIADSINDNDWVLDGDTLYSAPDSTVVIKGGNVGIGTTSPTAKLQIEGTTANSTAHALYVENNTPDALLRVRNDGKIIFGRSSSLPSISPHHSNGGDGINPYLANTATGLLFYTDYSSAAARGYFIFNHPLSMTGIDNDGVKNVTIRGGTDNSLRSGMYYTSLMIEPEIDATGGTTTFRGIYYNPTLTSTTGVTHIAFQNTTGDVLLGSASGNIGIGTTSPSEKLHIDANSDSLQIDNLASGVLANVLMHDTTTGKVVTTPLSSLNDNDWVLDGDTLYSGPDSTVIIKGGNVGIKTVPSFDLDLLDNTNTEVLVKHSSTTGQSVIYLDNDDDDGLRLRTWGTAVAGTIFNGALNRANLSIVSVNSNQKLAIGGLNTNNDVIFGGATSGVTAYLNNTLNLVGIGTTSPSNKLHVSASSDPVKLEGLQNDVSLDTVVMVDASGILHKRSLNSIADSINDNDWVLDGDTLYSAPDSAVVIRAGNVGIGRLNPQYELHIGSVENYDGGVGALIEGPGAGGQMPVLRLAAPRSNGSNGANADEPQIHFWSNVSNDANGDPFLLGSIGLAAENALDGVRDGAIIFRPGDNETLTERVRITSSGNVGIGTSSPVAPLHVYGNADFGAPYSAGAGTDFFSVDIDPTVGAGANNQAIALLRLRHRGSNGAFTGVRRPLLLSENLGGGEFYVQLYETGLRIGNYSGGAAVAIQNPSALIELDGFNNSALSYTMQVQNNNGDSIFAINNAGNVGIGNFSPDNPLHISASSDPLKLEGLQVDNGTDTVVMVDATGVLHKRSLDNIADSILDGNGIYSGSDTLPGNVTVYGDSNILRFQDLDSLTFVANRTNIEGTFIQRINVPSSYVNPTLYDPPFEVVTDLGDWTSSLSMNGQVLKLHNSENVSNSSASLILERARGNLVDGLSPVQAGDGVFSVSGEARGQSGGMAWNPLYFTTGGMSATVDSVNANNLFAHMYFSLRDYTQPAANAWTSSTFLEALPTKDLKLNWHPNTRSDFSTYETQSLLYTDTLGNLLTAPLDSIQFIDSTTVQNDSVFLHSGVNEYFTGLTDINIDFGDVWFVSVSGNDSTCEVGNPNFPCRTPWAAADSVRADSSKPYIHVFPGRYTIGGNGSGADRETDADLNQYQLCADSISIYLSEGTILESISDSIRIIISPEGPTYFSLRGHGTLKTPSGTNAVRVLADPNATDYSEFYFEVKSYTALYGVTASSFNKTSIKAENWEVSRRVNGIGWFNPSGSVGQINEAVVSIKIENLKIRDIDGTYQPPERGAISWDQSIRRGQMSVDIENIHAITYGSNLLWGSNWTGATDFDTVNISIDVGNIDCYNAGIYKGEYNSFTIDSNISTFVHGPNDSTILHTLVGPYPGNRSDYLNLNVKVDNIFGHMSIGSNFHQGASTGGGALEFHVNFDIGNITTYNNHPCVFLDEGSTGGNAADDGIMTIHVENAYAQTGPAILESRWREFERVYISGKYRTAEAGQPVIQYVQGLGTQDPPILHNIYLVNDGVTPPIAPLYNGDQRSFVITSGFTNASCASCAHADVTELGQPLVRSSYFK